MTRTTNALVLWLVGLLACSVLESATISNDFYNTHFFIVLQMPLYGLVLFGAYAMMSIGYHLFVLEDCNKASDELKGEIEEARTFLRKKGMKFE